MQIGNIAVGTDDRLDRARDLTVTSDGSRVYVPLARSPQYGGATETKQGLGDRAPG
ncbi:hypothetical protein [Microcoleus sp. herbarium14]|uniref:hypothetical protein n=1 Tax=Microcoleus sp. herbarium14 TaxID=3055439 RepID=UPI002FD665C7